MTTKKYYFIIFECTRYAWNDKGISRHDPSVNTCQGIIDKHPIQFQLDCNEKYGRQQPESAGGGTFREEYKIMNWIEMSKEEYKKYAGYVG